MSSGWAASALQWWSDAGVDTLVDEAPRNWLKPQPKPVPTAAAPAPAEALPADLDAFRAWFVNGARLPLGAPAAPRIGPAGDPASDLMILVDMPGAADRDILISGAPGALFDRMLSAIGRGRETIWLAPLSPMRTPTGRLDPAQETQLADIARHHVGLVKPKALLLFGDAVIDAPGLRVPHPHLHERAFALVPLLDVWPDARIPGYGDARDAVSALEMSNIHPL